MDDFEFVFFDRVQKIRSMNELYHLESKSFVSFSGGKDSMLMAKLFQELKKHSDFEFDVKYLVMNPGYNARNLEVIKNNLEIMKIPAVIKETDIFEIASIQTKSPCYLCAKMRCFCQRL